MVDAPGATTPISAPTITSVVAGNTINTITFSSVSGATAYNLYYHTATGVSKLVNTDLIAGITSPYQHTGLTNGVEIFYVVTAEDGITESDESTEASGTPSGSPTLGAPTLFSATPGDGTITLNWTNVSGATGYNIYWSTSTGVTQGTGTQIAGVTSPYIHEPLTNGTAIFYVVTAVDASSESADSAEVTATPRAASTGSAVALDYLTGMITVPLNAEAYDVEGWISYRRQAADSSISLKFECAGEEVFDRPVGPITLPSVQTVPVYGGIYYYGQAIYYGISFSQRLTRKKFNVNALSSMFQVRIQSGDVNALSVAEIGIRFRAAGT